MRRQTKGLDATSTCEPVAVGVPVTLGWTRRVAVPWLATLAGVIAAILAADVVVRQFDWEFRDRDVITVRQWSEGTSIAHYVQDGPLPMGWRSTGNQPIDGAPEIIIFGDSYVAARQVPDEATMGALVERWSRAAGRPLNVRQYGVSGGWAPAYAALASHVLPRWHPARVVVIVPGNDLDADAFAAAPYWTMRLRPDGDPEIVDIPPETRPRGVVGGTLHALQPYSALARVFMRRWLQLTSGPPAPPSDAPPFDPAVIPRASVTLLQRAYGDRLLIVHLPEITMRTGPELSVTERGLAEACHDAGVAYLSAHDAMFELRDRFVVARGFHNTLPGNGHLNATGHRVLAELIWHMLSDDPRTSMRRLD